jgi:uncharacterized protein (TIGR03118 family)
VPNASIHSGLSNPHATSLRAGSPRSKDRTRNALALTLLAAALCAPATAQTGGTYQVTNLVSDGSVPATTMDAHFINPWAMSVSPTWWISAQGTGLGYVVQPTGTIPFTVIVPPASGLTTATGLPAGCITTTGTTGMVLPNGTKASFLFSTLDGTISGWNSLLGRANAITQIVINNSAAGASYPGLAVINTPTASYLLAPNFGTANTIEVYDGNFKPIKLAGTFTDPNLPPNYGPFSVHVLGTQVFVAYAARTTTAPYRTVDAIGNGIVSIFDTSGNFVARAVTGGNLNSPWGVAIAPANFGLFSNALLIGNFGNGLINAYDPKTFLYLGQLIDGTGKPLTYLRLWELLPGGTAVGNTTSVSGGDTSTVYFTAGLTNEAHGLLGAIANNSKPIGTPTFGVSTSLGADTVPAGAQTQLNVSVVPTNNFSGTVNLACSGLPTGATCTFSSGSLTVSPTAIATSALIIQTTKSNVFVQPFPHWRVHTGEIFAALLLPLSSLLALFRRQSPSVRCTVRLLGLVGIVLCAAGFFTGCSNNNYNMSPSVPGTPTGTSLVTITATSGSIVQSTPFMLTVQ